MDYFRKSEKHRDLRGGCCFVESNVFTLQYCLLKSVPLYLLSFYTAISNPKLHHYKMKTEAKKLGEKKKTGEAASLETAIKINSAHFSQKFLHLSYAPVTSCDVRGSFSMFKNVLSDKHMSLKEDNLEKLVVHVSGKTKIY